ncbi:hypothetical protein ES705_25895 [subsurface metagenome]
MNTKFIYIAGGVSSTITSSQVVNWLDILLTNNIKFELVFTIRVIDIVKTSYRKNTFRLLNEIKRKQKVYLIPILRTKSNGLLFKTMVFFLLLRIRSFNKGKIIIQTRESKHFKVIGILKSLFNNISFIYEHRGVRAEEYINSLGYESNLSIDNKIVEKKYQQMLSEFRANCDVADRIINVSTKMNKYVVDKSSNENIKKTFVISGAADVDLFYFSSNLRQEKRKALNLNEDFVVLYTGRLDPTWQMKDFLFEFFFSFINSFKNAFVICLTPDIITANNLCKKFRINEDRIFIKQENNNKINAYLNASDVAVIFRENIATNYYSSPTKLAEYLISGTPIILSNNIGDYSDFINNNNLGIVVINNIDSILKRMKRIPEYNRASNAELSKKHFSKQSQLEKYLRMYTELVQLHNESR